jgi:hypothetical protein
MLFEKFKLHLFKVFIVEDSTLLNDNSHLSNLSTLLEIILFPDKEIL